MTTAIITKVVQLMILVQHMPSLLTFSRSLEVGGGVTERRVTPPPTFGEQEKVGLA